MNKRGEFQISADFLTVEQKRNILYNNAARYLRLSVDQFMNIEILREYCISKRNVTESFPFGDDTLVFKTAGRIFALVNLENDLSINLKCDPALAIELRERYSSVIQGYHMNKKHWNTVYIDGSVTDKEVFSWIDHSYDLVLNKK